MTEDHTHSPHARLIAKLRSIATLSPDEIWAIRQLPLTLSNVAERQDVVREGERPSRCCLLLDGFLCRYKARPHGRRQILSFHVPGDIPDLQSLHVPVLDHSLGTLTPATVAFVEHAALNDLLSRCPSLSAVLWRDTLIDASIFREWITNVGRRTSYQRVAHILCEFLRKLKAVGLADTDRCPFPIREQDLSDATGLSIVEVNRAIHKLKSEGLIVLSANVLSIPNWDALKRAGEFDPAYLHLTGEDAR